MENTATNSTIEQTPQTSTSIPVEKGKKYFRQGDVTWLYFFFGPIAGTYTLYKNSETLGNISTAKLMLRGGLLHSLLLTILLISVENIPDGLFPFIHAIGGFFYYEYNQKNSISYELLKGSSYNSRWKSFGVGILSILVFIVLFIIGGLMTGQFSKSNIESSINTSGMISGTQANDKIIGSELDSHKVISKPYIMIGNSMQPNINEGDELEVQLNTLVFKRGDIIVFNPEGKGIDYIKRIIGLPGEKITIGSGIIVVCGSGCVTIDLSQFNLTGSLEATCGIEEFQLTDGFFVLGDNLEHSSDSRCCFNIGCYDNKKPEVKLNQINGKVIRKNKPDKVIYFDYSK